MTGWEYTASPWVERSMPTPAFRSGWPRAGRPCRQQGLMSHIKQTIDAGAAMLADAAERNFSRWPVFGTKEASPRIRRLQAARRAKLHAQAVDYLKD